MIFNVLSLNLPVHKLTIMYERIKELCKKNKLTITALERELGFAKGSICKMETHKPSYERLDKIASRFNVSIEYLLGSNSIEIDNITHTWEVDCIKEVMQDEEMSKRLIAYANKLLDLKRLEDL